MDYSKLNNIAASIQDVENAASIVENRLTNLDKKTNELNESVIKLDNKNNLIINPKSEVESTATDSLIGGIATVGKGAYAFGFGGNAQKAYISGNASDGYQLQLNVTSSFDPTNFIRPIFESIYKDTYLLDANTYEKVAKITAVTPNTDGLKISITLDTDLGTLTNVLYRLENISKNKSLNFGVFGNTGDWSSILGYGSYNTGDYSNVIGSNNYNSKTYSTLIGTQNTNTGNYSTLIGYNNKATAGNYPCAIGVENTLNAYGYVIGRKNVINANGYAIGFDNLINTNGTATAFLIGQKLVCENNKGGFFIGQYNKEYISNDASIANWFAVGYGDSNSPRQNAIEVKQNADTYIYGVGGFTGANSDNTSIKPLHTVINGLETKSTNNNTAINTLQSTISNLNDKVDNNELVVSSSLVDLNEKVDDLTDKIDDNEKVVSAALNDLNDKIDNTIQPASNVSFDDSILHTGYDNVQDVLQVMYANIQGYVTELKINLKYPNSNPIVNKQVNITVYWHGDVYDLSSQYTSGFSGFKTDNNGNITIIIPYGSTYNLSFITLDNDYLTPEPISGTSDLNSITHNITYTATSNNENVIPTVYIASGSPSVSLDNKILYIDTIDSSDNVLVSHYRKGVLNSVGRLKAVYDENNTLLSDSIIEIARGVRYRIYLDLWDSTIPADNQSYVASSLQIYTASKARRLINLWYTNVSVGIFLAIKNINSEKGYDSYRMFEVDNPTETKSIGVTINNIDYEVYKNGNDIYKKQIGSSTGEPWIEYVNISTILGVGIKTIELESAQSQDSIIDSLGYSSLSIMLLRSVPYRNIAIQQYASPAFPFYNFADGMYVTRLWYNYGEGNTSPAAQYAIDSCTIQLVTENGTINIPAFIPSQLQIKPIVANYAFLVNVFYTINGTLPTSLTNGSALNSSSMSSNSSSYLPGRYIGWTKTNINNGVITANVATSTIFVYPFK